MPNAVFGFLLSGLMSLIVSGIATAKGLGLDALGSNIPNFFWAWMRAYTSAWPVAFAVVLLVAPVVRRLVNRWFGTP
jgi:hypothetical protein